MVAAGVAVWRGRSPKSQQNARSEMQRPVNNSPAEGQTEVAGAKVGGDLSEQTTLEPSERRAKKPLLPALVSSPQTKAPIPTASADAMRQIGVAHHFAAAPAAVWGAKDLVCTHPLL